MIGELKQRQRERQQQRLKSTIFTEQVKQSLCTCVLQCWYIALPSSAKRRVIRKSVKVLGRMNVRAPRTINFSFVFQTVNDVSTNFAPWWVVLVVKVKMSCSNCKVVAMMELYLY